MNAADRGGGAAPVSDGERARWWCRCRRGGRSARGLAMSVRDGCRRLGLAPRNVGRWLRRGWGVGVLGLGAVAAPPPPPNFVLVLGEGHGWSSTSVQMDEDDPASRSEWVRTPNFERLAGAGLRFAQFYASSPRCTPTRAALLTGKSPAQLRMTFVGEGRRDEGTRTGAKLLPPPANLELPAAEVTIAELLQRAGYATAHFGKWHLGRVDPREHGFAESDGPTGNGGPDNVDNPHPEQLYGMTARGLDFLRRQSQAGRPCFLQLSHYAARQGGAATAEAKAIVARWSGGSAREREEAAAMVDLDLALGQLLRGLDALGLTANTYVIFTTDHGTPGRNPPLAGGKGTVREGGLRVPLIIRGPGVAAGWCSQVRVVGVDLFPTLAELAGVTEPLPAGIEGGSLVPLLRRGGQGGVTRPRADYVVHFPHYDKDPAGPASALWRDQWKLIRYYETGRSALYDLAHDPGEKHDLAAQQPGRVQDLERGLTEYLTAIGAQLPQPNPAYDPSRGAAEKSQDVPAGKKRGGQRKSTAGNLD